MAPELRKLLADIGEPTYYDAVAPHWDDSLASLPPGSIEFLVPERLAGFRAMAGIDSAIDNDLLGAASRIAQSPALRALVWHCVRTSYDYEDVPWWSVGRWPSFEASLGESAPLFYLVVALAMVPLTVTRHRTLGVPEEITRQTIAGPGAFLQRYRDGNGGRPGIFRREVAWLRYNTSGTLYRAGRFEYMLRPFKDPFHAYRDSETGAAVLLAAQGERFTELGFADARSGEGEPHWWQAHHLVEGQSVRGFPVSPFGRVEHREVVLDLRRWKQVIDPQTTILDVHIPVGGKMTPEAIRSSFGEAIAFFSGCFPSREFAGFRCASWILGPQLEEIFPPTANLVRFLQEIYLYPTPSSPYDGFFFVFSDDKLSEESLDSAGLARLPERTTLQAKVKQYVRAGKPWRGGGMVFLKEDLERFGSQCYRSHWPPEALSR